MDERDRTRKVCVEFIVERLEVPSPFLGQIVCTLNTGVEVDAVDIRILCGNFFHELRDLVCLRDIKDLALRLVLAVLGDEGIKTLLATTDDNDLCAVLDEALGHGTADA